MQASKIKIDAIYAVKRGDDLVRFQVTAVVTRRVSNHGNPHDYESTVEGRIIEDANDTVVKFKPTALLGSYDEHVVLAARANQEREDRERAQEEAQQARVKLVNLLYSTLGVEQTKFPHDYDQPFRLDYGSVDIRGEGIKLLTDYLERK